MRETATTAYKLVLLGAVTKQMTPYRPSRQSLFFAKLQYYPAATSIHSINLQALLSSRSLYILATLFNNTTS